MIERARKKDKEAKIKFMLCNMRKLDKVTLHRKYDAAMCLGLATYHLTANKHVQSFLKGMHKLLKKNGLLVFDARNAKKINEDYLNKLAVEHIITEDDLQLVFLAYNTRHPKDPNTIIWRPICLMNENGKVDLQTREHRLRWFLPSGLTKMVKENGFEIIGHYAGTDEEAFDEDKHVNTMFAAVAK